MYKIAHNADLTNSPNPSTKTIHFLDSGELSEILSSEHSLHRQNMPAYNTFNASYIFIACLHTFTNAIHTILT